MIVFRLRLAVAIGIGAVFAATACTSSPATAPIAADIEIDAGPGVSEELAERAVRLTLGDPRLVTFLNDPASAEVRTHQYGLLLVDIRLGRPRDEADWLLDICDKSRSGPITAVRWILDAEGREILAVSPVWGTASCI